jgi:hypothetical protein
MRVEPARIHVESSHMRVDSTLFAVRVKSHSACGSRTLYVEINFVRVQITLVRVLISFVRVIITLIHVKITYAHIPMI